MLTGENGVLTKASTAKDETKKAQYKEILELIGVELRPEQIMNKLSSKDYMDRYEEKIQEEINKKDVLEGATKKRQDDNTILVVTKEGWIYKIIEEEVIFLGDREEYPEPPNLQEAEIKFSYEPSGWTNGSVRVSITTKADKFSIQYTTKDPNAESSWDNYPSTGVEMTENGDIHARLINELGETTAWATGNVSKIERTKPNLNVTVGSITINSIVVNVSASDTPSGLATSNTYQYYLNGTLVPAATGNSYQFTGLSSSTRYTIRVVVYDQAGNSNEQTVTPTTQALPKATSVISQSNYGNKVVYSANGISDWKIFYNDGTYIYIIISGYLPVSKVPSSIGAAKEHDYNVLWYSWPGFQSAYATYKDSFMITAGELVEGQQSHQICSKLLNPSNWTSFASGWSGSTYISGVAVGSPTLEMWIASWNAKGYTRLCWGTSSCGYTCGVYPTPGGSFPKVSASDALYFPQQGVYNEYIQGYWLSSPATYRGDWLPSVGYGGQLSTTYFNTNIYSMGALRPLVRIPSDVGATWNGEAWVLAK